MEEEKLSEESSGQNKSKVSAKPAPVAQREDPAELLPGSHDVCENGCTRCRACEHRNACGPGCCHKSPRNNLTSTNWLSHIEPDNDYELVEVSFKNTRKGYFIKPASLRIEIGDMVVVESSPGHDIGKITMTGSLVMSQINRAGIKDFSRETAKRILRHTTEEDLVKFAEIKALEHGTMIESRKIAEDLGLNMKIGDVEYQGDGNKAIFYYIADERVDFRQLIRVLADRFKIRIEMRQIGARQEAGRIGGIGPCGRPLCCATWLSHFVSVTTTSARIQDLSLNMQKLAGQCGKLKCCLNYEVDTYLEALKNLPDKNTKLETLEGTWFTFKLDVFKREFTFSSDKQLAANLVTIDAERVEEILEMNRNGRKPDSLLRDADADAAKKKVYNDILEEGNLNRFDNKKKKKKKKSSHSRGTQSDGSKNASSRTENKQKDNA